MTRSILSLYSFDEDPDNIEGFELIKKGVSLISKMPAIMAYSLQTKTHYLDHDSLHIHFPKKEYSFAENILYLSRNDGKFTELEAKTLDMCLMVHADHGGGNNSAFVGTVVSSTLTDIYSMVAASMCSLKGPRHGGANMAVLDMMTEVEKEIGLNPTDLELNTIIQIMIAKDKFLMDEIPFEKFEKLGISKQDFLAMPKELADTVVNGRVTPLMNTRIHAENGKVIEMHMKLQLTRDDNGNVLLQTYPMRKQIDNAYNLTDRELKKVEEGNVIKKEVTEDGEKKVKFIQLDQETKSLISRNVATVKLANKLRDMEKINDIELGANQKQAAQEGKPLELNVGDQKVTVGVDLREPQGFKIVNGDMKEWERQMKIKYDEEHEGFMGYVQTDENRWEYRQVVERLSGKQNAEIKEKEDIKIGGLKL